MEKRNSDEELDITSESFNPLRALYSENLKLPVGNVKRLDNLEVFLSKLKKAGNQMDADLITNPTVSKKAEQKKTEEDAEKYHFTESGRRFLKEQAPVHRGKKAKYTRNLLMKMDNAKGPISLLQKFKNNRTRVKIYIRKEHGVRGFITGYIEAFDKHFNLVLSDCVEVYRRRKFKFSDNKIIFNTISEDCSKLLAKMNIQVPEISVKSLDRKTVECTRRLNQVMVRGEDVVLVHESSE